VVPIIVLSTTTSQRLALSSVLQELVVFSRALIVATLSCVACPACMKVAPSALEKRNNSESFCNWKFFKEWAY
jgi:hypothetical protein